MQLFDVYPLFPIDIQRSHCCHVYDQRGRRYLDFYGGHAVVSIGHSHPHFLKRVKDQMDKIAFYSNFVENELREALAAKLGELRELRARSRQTSDILSDSSSARDPSPDITLSSSLREVTA